MEFSGYNEVIVAACSNNGTTSVITKLRLQRGKGLRINESTVHKISN